MSNKRHQDFRRKKFPTDSSTGSFYLRLIPFDLQPTWLKDNEFLQASYRPVTESYRRCINSIFSLHTETFNIWTHLLGSVFILLLSLSALYLHTFKLSDIPLQLYSLPVVEKVFFFLFISSAIFCLLGSTLFHIFSCHSQTTATFLNKIDYLGINLLIIGSSLPLLYYAFFCNTRFIFLYCFVFLTGGGFCCYFSFTDIFRSRHYRKIRPSMFIAMGCLGFIPVLHVYLEKTGTLELTERYGVHWLGAMAFFYVFGAFIYSMRIPERFFPGKFDIFAHSHQIWHLFVIGGILAHYECVLTTASYYHQHPDVCLS